MTRPSTGIKPILVIAPLIGCLLFIILYLIATFYYPGGSGLDKTAKGYTWTENYWCNLLNEKAINGQVNKAKPFAVIAMIILSLALSIFWVLFPIIAQLKKTQRILIQVTGLTAMLTSFLLITDLDHDIVVNTSSSFGFIAMIATIVALQQLKWNKLFWFGLFNILLIVLNSYLYRSGQMTYLPIVQKISFLSFLTWFSFIDLNLFRIVYRFNRR